MIVAAVSSLLLVTQQPAMGQQKMDKAKKSARKAPTHPEDEATSHLFGDTSIPKGRTEAFFIDELPRQATTQEKSETTASRAKRLELLAKQADAVSTAANVAWRKAHPSPQPPDPKLKGVTVRLGNEVLLEDAKYLDILKGKRIGLVTNATGMDSKIRVHHRQDGRHSWRQAHRPFCP